METAARTGKIAEVREQVWRIVSAEIAGGFVTRVLGRELGL